MDALSSLFAELSAPAETVSAESKNALADMFGTMRVEAPAETLSDETRAVMADFFAEKIAAIPEPVPALERKRNERARKYAKKATHVGVIDFETDPFDNIEGTEVYPFSAVIYADEFKPIVIWEENFISFKKKLLEELETIPEPYTFYAHNGGRFDFMFLISELRGDILFKGRAIMQAQLGKHELRDSFHIIPEKLANLQKDKFDYTKLKRNVRHKHRAEIIKYNINDCAYLLPFIKDFIKRFGFKISIGQAAMAQLRMHHRFERIAEKTDEMLRDYFFGGRVECIQGLGRFHGAYKLFDVNSMYPYVMATRQHPVGADYIRHAGEISANTIFIDLTCDSRGAFVRRNEETHETHAPHGRYRFKTTIWEYQVAKKYGLISNEEIHCCIDNAQRSDFARFIVPLYSERQEVKRKLHLVPENSEAWNELKKDDVFIKLLLNNAYGKFAQNPRRYKEHYISAAGEIPPDDGGPSWGDFPREQYEEYSLWERKNPELRFNNVGTGASITGAARAVLLEAMVNSEGPVYCDTDSLICKSLTGVKIDQTELGAWDIEREISEIIVCGKKLYGYRVANTDDYKVRAKGSSQLKWNDLEKMLEGETVTNVQKGVTLTKDGSQYYMTRRIRATAKRMTPWQTDMAAPFPWATGNFQP